MIYINFHFIIQLSEDSVRAIAFHDVGYSCREVANMLGFAKSVVERAVARFHETGSLGSPDLTAIGDVSILPSMILSLESQTGI